MGWRDVMADPKAAMEIFKKRVPEIDVDVIDAEHDARASSLMKTDRYAKNGIGWIDEKKMCDSVELVNTYMGLPKKVECKDVYSNEFLTKVEMPEVAGNVSGGRTLIDLDRVGMTYAGGERPGRGARRHLARRSARASSSRWSGPSGCGKSTLLRIVAGLRPATRGTRERRWPRGHAADSRHRHGVPGAGPAEVAHRSSTTCCCRPSSPAWTRRRYVGARQRAARDGGPRTASPTSCRTSCRAACSSAPRSAAPCCSIRRCC